MILNKKLFYKTPVWYAMRQHVIYRAGNICEWCQRRLIKHVHHRTYANFGGGEDLRDLMGVCRSCHMYIHSLFQGILTKNYGSLCYRGDTGFTSFTQEPGHWMGNNRLFQITQDTDINNIRIPHPILPPGI